jgi:hypothetical protein
MIGGLGGTNWQAQNPNFMNASGITLTLGMVVMTDILASSSYASSPPAGTNPWDYALDAMVTPATIGINRGFPVAVVLNDSVPNGFRFDACMRGVVNCLVNGAVAIGQNLSPVNAQNYLSADTGQDGPAISCAKALQANASGTATIAVLFEGMPARMNEGSV